MGRTKYRRRIQQRFQVQLAMPPMNGWISIFRCKGHKNTIIINFLKFRMQLPLSSMNVKNIPTMVPIERKPIQIQISTIIHILILSLTSFSLTNGNSGPVYLISQADNIRNTKHAYNVAVSQKTVNNFNWKSLKLNISFVFS